METMKMSTQEMNDQEMIRLNGGQYFKPTIDGTWLRPEPSSEGVFSRLWSLLFG